MKSVAVVGATGYVGSSILDHLHIRNHFGMKDRLTIVPVTRDNYQIAKKSNYDYLINCSMPSKRYWAEQNPTEDYEASVSSTKKLVEEWKFEKFIQISTISARCETNFTYGKHKKMAELLCPKGSLIIRLTAMYSENLSKGCLYEIIRDIDVFFSKESRYSFTPLNCVGDWIAHHLDEVGIAEIGSRGSVTLDEIAKSIGSKSRFGTITNKQIVKNSVFEFPHAKQVIEFARKERYKFKSKEKD